MLTATARKHIVRALRDALKVNDRHARDILETIRNENMLRLLDGRDMRSVKALVVTSMGHADVASLYLDDGRGFEPTGVDLRLTDADMQRWNRLPLEEAYAIAADIHENRGQAMIDADDRIAAEAAATALDAANDDHIDLDAIMGPVPESRDWAWTDGTVVAAETAAAGDHVVATVDKGEGLFVRMTMLPLFSGVADLLDYVTGQIGVPARLCVGRLNAFDNDHPAGVDKELPLLDMIVHRRDVPHLTSLYHRAA